MSMEKRQSLADFITEHGITMRTRARGAGTQRPWVPGTRHYTVTLSMDGRQLSTPFHHGPGIESVELRDVVSALITDSATYENARSFADWCSELGESEDSRSAYRTWKACQAQAEKLRVFLGNDYEHALWELEDEVNA